MQFFRQEQFDSPSVHFMDAYLPEARQQVQSEDFRIADEGPPLHRMADQHEPVVRIVLHRDGGRNDGG